MAKLTNEMINDISAARIKYDAARSRRSGIADAQKRLSNMFINCYEDIVDLLIGQMNMTQVNDLKHQIKQLEMNIESLNAALDAADKENNDLRKQIKSLNKRVKTVNVETQN